MFPVFTQEFSGEMNKQRRKGVVRGDRLKGITAEDEKELSGERKYDEIVGGENRLSRLPE